MSKFLGGSGSRLGLQGVQQRLTSRLMKQLCDCSRELREAFEQSDKNSFECFVRLAGPHLLSGPLPEFLTKHSKEFLSDCSNASLNSLLQSQRFVPSIGKH